MCFDGECLNLLAHRCASMQNQGRKARGFPLGTVSGDDTVIFNHLNFLVLVHRLHGDDSQAAAEKAAEPVGSGGDSKGNRSSATVRRHRIVCVTVAVYARGRWGDACALQHMHAQLPHGSIIVLHHALAPGCGSCRYDQASRNFKFNFT